MVAREGLRNLPEKLGGTAEAARPRAIAAGRAPAARSCGAWGIMALHSPQDYDFLVDVMCLPLLASEGQAGLFANAMERMENRRFFDAMAAVGARAVDLVEHRFVDIGAGLPKPAARAG
jgi:hypothetical protein